MQWYYIDYKNTIFSKKGSKKVKKRKKRPLLWDSFQIFHKDGPIATTVGTKVALRLKYTVRS